MIINIYSKVSPKSSDGKNDASDIDDKLEIKDDIPEKIDDTQDVNCEVSKMAIVTTKIIIAANKLLIGEINVIRSDLRRGCLLFINYDYTSNSIS